MHENYISLLGQRLTSDMHPEDSTKFEHLRVTSARARLRV